MSRARIFQMIYDPDERLTMYMTQSIGCALGKGGEKGKRSERKGPRSAGSAADSCEPLHLPAQSGSEIGDSPGYCMTSRRTGGARTGTSAFRIKYGNSQAKRDQRTGNPSERQGMRDARSAQGRRGTAARARSRVELAGLTFLTSRRSSGVPGT